MVHFGFLTGTTGYSVYRWSARRQGPASNWHLLPQALVGYDRPGGNSAWRTEASQQGWGHKSYAAQTVPVRQGLQGGRKDTGGARVETWAIQQSTRQRTLFTGCRASWSFYRFHG